MPAVEKHSDVVIPVQKNKRLFAKNNKHGVKQLRKLPREKRTDEHFKQK
jgi:hypothetical protein